MTWKEAYSSHKGESEPSIVGESFYLGTAPANFNRLYTSLHCKRLLTRGYRRYLQNALRSYHFPLVGLKETHCCSSQNDRLLDHQFRRALTCPAGGFNSHFKGTSTRYRRHAAPCRDPRPGGALPKSLISRTLALGPSPRWYLGCFSMIPAR